MISSKCISIFLVTCLTISIHVTASLHLDGVSFSVRSKLTRVINDAESLSSQVHESYSVEQRRAKLEYMIIQRIDDGRDKNSPNMGTFYVDTSRKQVTLLDSYTNICKASTVNELTKTIFEEPFILEETVAADFIVGPARILFFIDKHRDKLKLYDLKSHLQVRNLPVRMYYFDYMYEDVHYTGSTRFYVFYTNSVGDEDDVSPPIQVIMELHDQQILVIEFSHLKILQKGHTQSEAQLKLMGGNILTDRFAVHPSCLEALSSYKENLFREKQSELARFAFKSHIDMNQAGGYGSLFLDSYVAYDGPLDALRFDILNSYHTSGALKQIFDFRRNRMYHILERVEGSNTPIDKILDLSELGSTSNGDGMTETTQCMVAPILKEQQEGGKPLTLGRLIAGSDHFVYIGRAQVRGIEAFVYEAIDAISPFWLDQPIGFKTTKGEFRIRNPDRAVGQNKKTRISLYLTNNYEELRPLMMEITKINTQTSIVYEKQTVYFSDFDWSLDSDAPNGDTPSELFSLVDLCSAKMGENHYSKVELLLRREGSTVETRTLDKAHHRNLALLASLQSTFGLPAVMVFDLESKSIKQVNGPDGRPIRGTEMLEATFRVSEHVEHLTEIVYLGQGRLQPTYEGAISIRGVRSFQACFFLTSHCRANVYFAFNPFSKVCIIDPVAVNSRQLNPEAEDELPPNFIMDPSDYFEVYRIDHTTDPASNEAISWLEQESYANYRLKFMGQTLKLREVDFESYLSFRVQSVLIDDRDHKTSINSGSNQRQQFETDRIPGFGLVEDDAENQRVWPTPESPKLTDGTKLMTLDQCQTACMTNFECQSYSVCIRNSETQCVVSKMSFRSPSVIAQIASINRKSLKRGSQFDVSRIGNKKNEEQSTKLIFHPNCDLYNKIYIDFFQTPSTVSQTFSNRRLYAVGSQEDCAELCFKQNMDTLRGDVNLAIKSLSSIGPNSIRDDNLIHSAVKKHQQAMANMCKSFLYLDRGSIPSKQLNERIQTRLLQPDKVNMDQVGGFCALGDRPVKSERDNMEKSEASNEYIEVERYPFKFEIFYEKQYGQRIIGSPMRKEELQAFQLVKRRREDVNETTFAVLRAFVERGDNSQAYVYADEAKCAMICFIRQDRQGPWPACRSFDISIEDTGKGHRVVCYLNSITLNEAKANRRFDLIAGPFATQELTWHYEPSSGLTSDESIFNKDFQMAEDNMFAFLNSRLDSRIHTFGVLCIILLGLVSGLLFGLRLGYLLISRQQQVAATDKETLVEQSRDVEFSNQVNSEGIIPV